MVITSIDIETTGLNPDNCQILQIGAVVFRTDTEKFEAISTYNKIMLHPIITGDPFALNLNTEIIKRIHEYNEKSKEYERKRKELMMIQSPETYEIESKKLESLKIDIKENSVTCDTFVDDFVNFMDMSFAFYMDDNNKKHANVAGKNYMGFDNNFLKKIDNWEKRTHFHRRCFDPSIIYANGNDNCLPSLSECKQRCIEHAKKNNINPPFINSTVSHDALDDAFDVAELIWYGLKYILKI